METRKLRSAPGAGIGHWPGTKQNRIGYACSAGTQRGVKVIKLKSITLTRGEGPAEECGKPKTVFSWREADSVLRQWSETAPECNGYDKVDFTITYEDGETYKGRYDLKHHRCETPDLAKHVRGFVSFHAGKQKPAWMTDEEYQRYVSKMKPEFEHFLEHYEIGG